MTSPSHIVIGGPDGRARHEGTFLARPSVGGTTHSRLPGSGFISLDLGDGSVSRPQRCGGCRRTTGHRTALKFVPISVGVGNLIPIGFHRALTVYQDLSRVFADQFQVLSLSASSRGLVADVYGQHTSERKQTCPTEGRANPARNRVNVS